MRRLFVFLVFGGMLLLTAVGSAAFGMRVGISFERNYQCCGIAPAHNVWISTREAAGLLTFPSQIGQDRWVAEQVFPGVRGGYFLDVGSADGFRESNTWALERRGWTGICIDPFPKNMTGRTCRLFTEAVDSVGGRTVSFTAAGALGGITAHLGNGRDNIKDAKTVEVRTATLAEILQRANAPAFIHFMSLDIEGAELEALKGFPFDRYTLGALAIEHNYEEPKRSDIRRFLASQGYDRSRAWRQDDFYLPHAR